MQIIQKYITPNQWSRPQLAMKQIRGVVIHWTGSPMGNWNGVWNFFDGRKNGQDSFGSAQFIVGLDGTTVQTMPLNEMAYAVGSTTYPQEAIDRLGSYPNNSTLSIEMCVLDDNGNMNPITVQNTKELCVKLLQDCGLTENDLWLHKEVVGWKECHKFYCDHPNEWQAFKNDVGRMLRGEPIQPKSYLSKGDRGDAVVELQKKLIVLGYQLQPDGIFGGETDWCVRDVQSKNGLAVDGEVGKITMGVIDKEIMKLEVAKMISKYFKDQDMPEWIAPSADDLHEKGLLSGRQDATGNLVLDWNSPITRGEAVVLFDRVVNYLLQHK